MGNTSRCFDIRVQEPASYSASSYYISDRTHESSRCRSRWTGESVALALLLNYAITLDMQWNQPTLILCTSIPYPVNKTVGSKGPKPICRIPMDFSSLPLPSSGRLEIL